ncbi:hypothetical protein ASE08_23890 [Rhizobacter sp. Root16D2]|nr:hypothetical protein ASC88_17835 [Rhizobacter sp. Root29]KQW02185.1 hypothetical protein ASC98_28525 [Rhizobacter sp. Root1238]KRB19401.1 hypothetical protein ASE08_23890 [Rhizobacter sp. Root16D2]
MPLAYAERRLWKLDSQRLLHAMELVVGKAASTPDVVARKLHRLVLLNKRRDEVDGQGRWRSATLAPQRGDLDFVSSGQPRGLPLGFSERGELSEVLAEGFATVVVAEVLRDLLVEVEGLAALN